MIENKIPIRAETKIKSTILIFRQLVVDNIFCKSRMNLLLTEYEQ